MVLELYYPKCFINKQIKSLLIRNLKIFKIKNLCKEVKLQMIGKNKKLSIPKIFKTITPILLAIKLIRVPTHPFLKNLKHRESTDLI
jgi:DNA helicase IV